MDDQTRFDADLSGCYADTYMQECYCDGTLSSFDVDTDLSGCYADTVSGCYEGGSVTLYSPSERKRLDSWYIDFVIQYAHVFYRTQF